MKKILVAVTLAIVFAMSTSVVAEEEKVENPARKAAVEKCTKDGKVGKDLETCVDAELKVAEKKPAEQKPAQ